MSRLFVSAAHKSSGKTTVSIGICAALRNRGQPVTPFKKGPDYIDPLWLATAAGEACYNLDFNIHSPDELKAFYLSHQKPGHLSVIEANKGLHDGLSLDGSDSNAAVASLLDAPVVLVIDSRGMSRGVAPLIQGFAAFDPELKIAGVILNQVGGPRHEQKLRASIEHYTDIPVIGAVRSDPALAITERHLGLVPENEHGSATEKIDLIAGRISDQVDLSAVIEIAGRAPEIHSALQLEGTEKSHLLRIAVARDAAFGFYYADDLEALTASGAELIFVDLLRETGLPDNVDGLIIGGGFPETHMQALAGNRAMLESISTAIEQGLPVYAECGGLMYLSRYICWNDDSANMAGVFPFGVSMQERPSGRGYIQIDTTTGMPWPDISPGTVIKGHEFHYSKVDGDVGQVDYVYDVKRGHGIDGIHDGVVYRNVLASYAHLRNTPKFKWTEHFLDFVASVKR